MLKRWAIIVGLSMTPALIAGQSAACVAGIGWQIDPWRLVPVIALASFVEGAIVAWLAGTTRKIAFLERRFEKLRTPKAIAFAQKWGTWGGMILGVAVLGQEPILLALRFLGVEMRKLWLPLFVSNVLFALVYFAVVKTGLDQIGKLF